MTLSAHRSSLAFHPRHLGAAALLAILPMLTLACGGSGSKAVATEALPTQPTITAPRTVTALQEGCTASVPLQAMPKNYSWSISGGTITAGSDTPEVTFTAGGVGQLSLACTITNAKGSVQGRILVPVEAGQANVDTLPSQPTISAPAALTALQTEYRASVPAQAGVHYTWAISNGTLTSGATSPVATFTAGTVGQARLTCTLTNAAGSTQGDAIRPVQAGPIITLALNNGVVTASTRSADLLTYQWKLTGGRFLSSSTAAQVSFEKNGEAETILTLTVIEANTASTETAITVY